MASNVSDSPERIVLIGYRGTGKTSVGRLLAKALTWQCLDADVEIERRAGASIKEIFQREGEEGFRRRESEVVIEWAALTGVVLSLGGGAVLREENRRAIGAAGSVVVWLTAPAETLWRRIAADATSSSRRPNLTAGGGVEEVAQLLAQREPLYRQAADWRIDTENQPPEGVAQQILSRLGR